MSKEAVRRKYVHTLASLDRIDLLNDSRTLALIHYGYRYEFSGLNAAGDKVKVTIYREEGGLTQKTEFDASLGVSVPSVGDGVILTIRNQWNEVYLWRLPAFEAWYLRHWMGQEEEKDDT